MQNQLNRLKRERRTIEFMIEIYCRSQHHPTEKLCAECRELLKYAMYRIDKCPFQSDKPTCAKCSIHCYRPAQREQVRQVMRYAGPRMMLYHPMLAAQHIWDEIRPRKRKPGRDGRKQGV